MRTLVCQRQYPRTNHVVLDLIPSGDYSSGDNRQKKHGLCPDLRESRRRTSPGLKVYLLSPEVLVGEEGRGRRNSRQFALSK